MPGNGKSETRLEWDPALVSAIAGAIEDPAETYDLSDRVREALDSLTKVDPAYKPPSHALALRKALDYHARRPTGQKHSPDELYGPMVSWTNGESYPEPLVDVSPETIDAWEDLLQLYPDNCVVVARLNDLLWLIKAKPAPHLHARAAAAAFCEEWEHKEIHAVHRADALIRALEISGELNDDNLMAETVAILVPAVEEVLALEEWSPGVALPMIEALASLRSQFQPPDLDRLIEESLDVYSSDPFIVESILLLKMRRVDPDERAKIGLQAVRMWKELAEKLGGFVGISYLERALELANNAGLTDAAQDVRVLLQQPRTAEDLGMQKISAEVTISADELDKYVDFFVSTGGIGETFRRLASESPTRDPDADAASVREQMKDYPIQHLVNGVVTNEDGLALAHLTNDEQKFANALNRHQSLAITLWGSLLSRVFTRLHGEGLVTGEQLRQNLDGYFIDAYTANGAATAWGHMHAGDYEAALHYLLVRIERSIRTVARTIGISIYKQPTLDGKNMGAYRGLGELLSLLKGHVPEFYRRYFAVLLAERTGVNLRNRSAHGLMQKVSMDDAALAMHVLIIISLWGVDEDDDPAGGAPNP